MITFRVHVLVTLALIGLAGGAFGATEEKPDPSAPKPAKDNSFEYDAYMRHTKYPLSIVLIETEGKDAKNVPMTLSVACGESDYPAGQLTPVLDGKALPAQLNVLATWPKGGSIKHALVSFVLPAISAKQRLEITFKKEAPTPPGKFEAAVDLRAFTARTQFAATQGERTTTSSVPADTMAQIAKALSGELPAEDAKKIAPRLCGPLCYEFEILAPDGKIYRNNPVLAIPYQMAVDVRTRDFTDPKNVKETNLRTITDNTGAIYYYTAVNEQNAYPQVSDELLAKLPKKVMQPEDWKFDPEITRKRDEVEVRKSLHNPGYHDEANGPTSAALARYDNPKAQKMYEFVRALIEKAYGPNRIRGVEYVK